MRPYLILIAVGFLVAALAALVVRSTVPQDETAAAPAVETAKIVIASETIPAGTFVQAGKQLAWGEWPKEKVQSPPYMTEGGATLESFNGAVARRTIFAGEPISQGALVKSGEGGFMPAVLQAGMRAVSVAVTATSGNAGFIFPGDKVDLILTHSIEALDTQNFASETFVRDVRVLAVDQMLDNPENKALLAKTVTLEVTPQQAEAINVANEMGTISLSLRSLASDDAGKAEAAPAPPANPAEAELSGEVAKEAVTLEHFYPADGTGGDTRGYTRDSDISPLMGAGKEAPTTRVRVIRGDETTEIEFRQSH